MNIIRYIKIALIALISFSSCKEDSDPAMEMASRLRDVSRLELSQMTVGKVGMISDHKYEEAKTLEEKTRAMLDAMKIGSRVGVYSYDTYMVAYIDMERLTQDDVTFDKKTNTLHVKLPPVEVMTDGREPQLHEVHYRVTGLRSSIKPEERAALKSQMAAEVKQEMASDTGSREILKDEAQRKAIAWFSEIISSRGYVPEITFKQ